MERKISEKIKNILLNEFENYLVSENTESGIKEYLCFYFSVKKKSQKGELRVDLRKAGLRYNTFWEYKDESKQLVKLNTNGSRTYYRFYDMEDVTIFVAEIDLLDLKVEIIHEGSEYLKTFEMELKTDKEINNILLNEFNAYLLNEKAEFWIGEYADFYSKRIPRGLPRGRSGKV